jgi:integrase
MIFLEKLQLKTTNWRGRMKFDSFAMSVIDSIPVREKTRNNYKSVYRCHIEKHLGELFLGDIGRSHIQGMLIGLPAQTAAMTLALTKTIFREALARELLEASPAHGVRSQTLIVPARKFLTWEELLAADFGKWTPQIRFLALHGLRWGEAVVLTKEDVRDGRVYITKSIHGSTKTQSGNRVVPLVGEFNTFPKSPKTLRRALEPYGVHIHSLRHTYAYLLKTQGVHVTTAQRLMGHSDPKVTMKVYTQVLDDEIDQVGVLLAKVS